ncbi:universal stress protein [Natronorubrum sp. DTA7]|uniref:universal stress protein n=1 Tax=Natronorubrum sp. DTA7 TaxID=3447016 RepID=UPI003F82F3C7
MFEHILIPTDGSDAARSAAKTGIDLAAEQDATVHVLSVVKPIHSDEGGVEQAIESMRAARERTVAELAELAEAKGLVATTDVTVGVPVRKIIEYIEANDIDLVVMGTHGRTGVSRFLIGSVTEKVVRLSEIPVLTIHTGSKDKK